jgi:hypothetical protein
MSSDVFQTKYDEFADELLATFPELTTEIRSAVSLDEKTRIARWQAEVKSTHTSNLASNPGTILPGVTIPDATWSTLSEATRSAIWEYLKLLSICSFLESGFTGFDASGAMPGWMDEAMKGWKEKLESVDFESIMGKFSSFFKGSTDASGSASPFPKLPEKFLKGQIAKLAEEIIKDIKPEDLGLTPEIMEECEKSPSRSFDILIQLFTKNPAIIQKTIQRIGKRLQQKVQSGAIRPQEIAKEAEELMKEFASNSEFGDLLGSLKGMFGGGDDDDFDFGKATGGAGNTRLSAVKERLRKKMEAKKSATVVSSTSSAPQNVVLTPEDFEDETPTIIKKVSKPKNKKK